MAEQFKEQGGVATMDPSHLTRWLTSRLMTRISRPAAVAARHLKAEQLRAKAGAPHRVDYFHQVDEGYSHLSAQLLKQLAERYDIELHCHLVAGQAGKNAPEPELLAGLARKDSHLIAPGYGLAFPDHPEAPRAQQVELAFAAFRKRHAQIAEQGQIVACCSGQGGVESGGVVRHGHSLAAKWLIVI